MKITTSLVILLLITTNIIAQDIQLPKPIKSGGKPLMDCLAARKSTKNFDGTKQIDKKTLSNLLWAAWGYNRDSKRTAPSSRNKQEIDIYVALPEGMYVWDAEKNLLSLLVNKDLRKATGKQNYVENAAVNLVYVCSISRCDTKGDQQKLTEATYANAGFISQNVYLFCASEGLGTVVRGYVDKKMLAKEMKLTKDQMIVLCQSVGY